VELKEKQQSFGRQQQKRDELCEFRSIMLIAWLGTNAAAVSTVSSVFDYDASGNKQGQLISDPKLYMKGLFFAVSFFNVIRLVGSVLFLLLRCIPSFSGRSGRRKAKKAAMRNARQNPNLSTRGIDMPNRESFSNNPMGGTDGRGVKDKKLKKNHSRAANDAKLLGTFKSKAKMPKVHEPVAEGDTSTDDTVSVGKTQGGWEETTSENGDVYYFNQDTGDTSWEKPKSWL
jgi:hypothetical protein